MKLASGVRLGPYEIVAPIGAGGMGEVYRARDTRLDRTVAVKILPAEFAEDARLRARFEREAKTISALNHPHICALYDVGPDYLVMEHCEGRPLKGPLPLEKVLDYGIQIADALDKAHRQGIIHRDLKPSNIMLTKSGVKLLDFGLAKQHTPSTPEEATVQKVTEEGKILGTIQYMAPELFHGNEADARSDIFALGLVLYEMVTGKAAFSGTSKASLIAAILEHQPPPSDAPPPLDRLIRACLAKDPDERIQTAHDVKLQLKWTLEGAAPVQRRTARFAWSSIAVVVLTALVATLVTWLVARPRTTQQPLRRFSILLPSSAPIELWPAISRDGRRIVYRSSDTAPLSVHSLDTVEIKQLPGTEGATWPFFSPDGEWIGFWAGGELKKIAVAGGAPLLVCKTEQLRGATWLPDETIVFSSPAAPLQRVASAGGTPQALTGARANNNEYWPRALPDGQHVLYTIGKGTGEYEQAKIAILSLREDRPRVVMEGGTCARYARGHLIYSRSGTLFAVPFDADKLKVTGSPVPIANDVAGFPWMGVSFFDVADDGTLVYVPRGPSPLSELVWVDRKGTATPVSNLRRNYASPRISPDGRQIAVEVLQHGSAGDLWLFNLQRETWTRLTSSGQNMVAAWSPDGKQIFFGSNRNGPYNVYATPSDGSEPPRQLTHDQKAWTFPAAILHGGNSLLVWRNERGVSAFCLVDLARPDITKPFLTTHGDTDLVNLSPDARWIAYASDETGRYEIYLSAFPSLGRKWVVSTEGGIKPRFRRDSRELFYRNGNKMMAVDVILGPEPIIGKPRTLFEGEYEPEYDVTPDGQRFVMVRGEKRPPTLQVNVITGLFDNLSH